MNHSYLRKQQADDSVHEVDKYITFLNDRVSTPKNNIPKPPLSRSISNRNFKAVGRVTNKPHFTIFKPRPHIKEEEDEIDVVDRNS